MHFFIDHLQLGTQAPEDGFGADSVNPSTLYNVTSMFQLTGEAKAFACQRSMMIVQQSSVDDSLVNLILKPTVGGDVPLGVSYYVYRGVLKSSLIAGSNIAPQAPTNNELIKRIWSDPPQDAGSGTLGFDDNTFDATDDVETIFDGSRPDVKPILVTENEWVANFTGDFKIGFEVILKTDALKIDLDYARKGSHQVDVTGLAGFDERAKREEILYFIDPAAFFGAHHGAGVRFSEYSPAKVTKTTNRTQTSPDHIYTRLLSKFATGHRVYLDVRSERTHSYNFYRNYGDPVSKHNIKFGHGAVAPVSREYETGGWPIVFTDSAQTTTTAQNSLRLRLRVDDNVKPVIFVEDKTANHANTKSNYIQEKKILDGAATDWTAELKLVFPNTGAGAAKDNIASYIKLYYFRQRHNPASPATVLRNLNYYDSAFCSVDLRNLGEPAASDAHAASANLHYVREPLRDDGTGNFGYTATSGAHWDDQRILFYSTLQNDGSKYVTSDKCYLNAYTRKLDINKPQFTNSLLRWDVDILCREYDTDAGMIKILGLNSYRTGGIPNRTAGILNEKENALLLGLGIPELTAIKTAAGLSANHRRYIFLEPEAANPLTDTGGMRYHRHTIRLQGLDANGMPHTVTPQLGGSPILVYSRDNRFFNSASFSSGEAVSPGTNRIELHVYHDGCVKINDNIDLSLVHDVQNVFYFYHDADGVVHEVCNLDVLQINKMGKGQTVAAIPAGHVSTIDYTPHGVNAKTSYIYQDGSVVTNGLKKIKNVSYPNYKLRYPNTGKKAFLVDLPEINFAAADIEFTYSQTRRRYCSPEVAAAFLGALARVGFALESTGSCFEDGTSFPSVEHNNGYAIDTIYLTVLANDQAFVNAMHDFGCKKILRGIDAYSSQLTVATNGKEIHNSHLHSGDVQLNNCDLDE